ncbi:hypothetical protein GA8_17780 [Geobacillus sp. A8]|nr:hypothetical protein GA8_17780 [Geobacillus sp. A8]
MGNGSIRTAPFSQEAEEWLAAAGLFMRRWLALPRSACGVGAKKRPSFLGRFFHFVLVPKCDERKKGKDIIFGKIRHLFEGGALC